VPRMRSASARAEASSIRLGDPKSRAMAGQWGPEMQGVLANVREKTRTLVADEIREIDSLVESLFSTTEGPIASDKTKTDQALMF